MLILEFYCTVLYCTTTASSGAHGIVVSWSTTLGRTELSEQLLVRVVMKFCTDIYGPRHYPNVSVPLTFHPVPPVKDFTYLVEYFKMCLMDWHKRS